MAIFRAAVKVGAEQVERLIDAPNEARALKHVAAQHITLERVSSAEQIKQMAALAAKGVRVETATAETE